MLTYSCLSNVHEEPLRFRFAEVDGFRYRVENAMRAVTRAHVKEARLREIKSEMLNSRKLKSHFEDNPHELDLLRHDKVHARFFAPAQQPHGFARVV